MFPTELFGDFSVDPLLLSGSNTYADVGQKVLSVRDQF
uniref:Uncharacterized protein n=1 Tax=Anguilla anguilla TaxID=7936 RepID=A0A0E9QNT5_ANGAN